MAYLYNIGIFCLVVCYDVDSEERVYAVYEPQLFQDALCLPSPGLLSKVPVVCA